MRLGEAEAAENFAARKPRQVFLFCASVPCFNIGTDATEFVTLSATAVEASTRATSSSIRRVGDGVGPRAAVSSGISMPQQPSLAEISLGEVSVRSDCEFRRADRFPADSSSRQKPSR